MVPLTHPRPQIKYRGKMPKSYYLHNQVRVHYEHTVTLGHGSSLQLENEILFPRCVLRYRWWLLTPSWWP